MLKQLPLLFFVGAIFLSSCGTFEVSIEGTPTSATPTPTSTVSPTVLPQATLLPPTPTATLVQSLTPPATPAITSTPPCDLAEFIADVTVPDATIFKPRDTFTKTWRLKNIGTCSWTTQYALVFVRGQAMIVPEPQHLAGTVAPGEMVDVSVNLTAPETPDVYSGYWALENASGARVSIPGSSDATFYVNIKVVPETASFKVTVDSLAVSCQKSDFFTVTATITSNGPGTISYSFSNGGSDPPSPTTLTFDSATTLTVTRDMPFSVIIPSHPELAWVQIMVSGPNQEIVSDQDALKCP